MRLDLPDNLVSDLLKVLAEVPAKHSYVLLTAINAQAAEHNKRIQALMKSGAGTQAPVQGVSQADPQE